MARLAPTLKAMFSNREIEDVMSEWLERTEWQIEQAFIYAGEEFVNKARLTGNYMDQTGNLRSSIGYVILHNREVGRANLITRL